MNDAVRLIALNAAFAVVGLVVLRFAGIPGGRGWRGTLAGLSPAVGLATCGLAAAVCAMTGLGVGLLATGIVVVLVLAAAGLVLRGRRPGLASLGPRLHRGVVIRVIELALLVLLGVLSVGVLRLYAATGLTQWDGWAMWAPKAHALYVEHDVWGPVFRDPAYLMQHQEYPVLLPSLQALSADAVDRFDRALIDIETGAVLVSFGWGAWAILRLVVAPWLSAGVALALTGSVPLIDNGSGNYADTALAAFTALGFLCAFVWLSRGATALLVLSALFFAAAASTKAEGLLYALAAIAAVLAVARGFGRSLRSVAWFSVAVLAVPAMWAVVDRLNGPGAKNVDRAALTNPSAMVDASGRIPESARRLLSESWNRWPVACALVVLGLASACVARRWWEAAFGGLWGGLSLAALIGVYYANAAPIDWLLETSADRVVFSGVLGLAVSAPLLVGAAWETVVAHSDDRTRASPPIRPDGSAASRIAP